MSAPVHSDLNLTPPVPNGGPRPATFGEVLSILENDPALAPVRLRDMVSALRTAARLFEQDPAFVSTDLPQLRKRFRGLSPAACGFSKGRWNNMRSLVTGALLQAGVRVHQGRATQRLNETWVRFRDALPDKRHAVGLSRFMSFCSAGGIAPDAVTDASFAAFATVLRENSLIRTGDTIVRRASALWNSVAGAGSNELSSVAVVEGKGGYSLEWSVFPASLQADVEAFLGRLGSDDPFAEVYVPKVRASTVAVRRMQLQQLASALVHAGQPIEGVIDLKTLVQFDNAKLALEFLYNRAGRQRRKYLHKQALLLKTVARYWVKDAPPTEVEGLTRICRYLAVKETGMVEKNRVRLRQFDNAANTRALLNLPRRVFAELRRHDDGSRKVAVCAMKALAVELLIAAPIRADNLAGLRVGENLVRIQVGKSRTRHLVLSAEETKNHAPYQVQLPPEADRLLEIYLQRFHGRLSGTDSEWLFPNPMGERRSTVAFAQLICRFVEAETGIRLNLHLFRHTAVKLLLDANPEELETARRLLGHRNINTTIAAYAEAQSASAFRRYDAVVAGLRETVGSARPTKSRTSPETRS